MGRKEKKYHFIYKTTNILSGRYYIGMHSTDNLEDSYLGSGRRLKFSLNKYGKENFIREILEFCESRDALKQREAEIVNLDEIAKEECINLRVGGDGGGRIWSDEHMEVLSKSGNEAFIHKLHNDPKFREEFSKKVRENNLRLIEEGKLKSWSETYDWTGKNHSDETKLKMSKSKKGQGHGKTNSQYGTMWITNEVENKKIKKGEDIPEGWRKGKISKLNGSEVKQSKLTEKDVIFIRESLLNKTHTKKALAEKFKVSLNNIYRIKTYQIWSWV